VSRSVPGATPDIRWTLLGKPDAEIRNLYNPSAFVRTNCAHTVSVSPGPRLIVTVALDKNIQEIFGP